MNQDQIIKQLSSLRGLQPGSSFASETRLKVIQGARPRVGGLFIFSQSLSNTLSIGLVIVFFIFLALSGTTNFLRGPALPTFEGINGANVVAEADNISDAADIYLQEVQYLQETQEKKLARASIVGEISPSADEEIDRLLDEAKSY
ncbi:MAG: hypothetical protein A2Y84_01485 [Candidatus Colwellbacteria bacterium RBG_13_48_8]|uniref:Uncharacterized protein n=1 Tax=Candidatus Colwellbacteria bacterium RBG_13_48_8 TaxID=1797685 RepID=A0A1G1YYL8_9BACT|nr:MAG: hypothetical protein A2Y84_01485 [Candidatus Colwellbacteria bacterium RBG_13_48_8]